MRPPSSAFADVYVHGRVYFTRALILSELRGHCKHQMKVSAEAHRCRAALSQELHDQIAMSEEERIRLGGWLDDPA